jgi:hypothetical protein
MKKLLLIVPVFLFAFALTASAGQGGDWNHGGDHGGCDHGSCQQDDEDEGCTECPELKIENKNESSFDGTVNSSANSGWNSASFNGGLGKIVTGNVWSNAIIESRGGDNTIRVTAPLYGEIGLKNYTSSHFGGSVDAVANSGGNDASGNWGLTYKRSGRCMPTVTVKAEGEGNIKTGDVDAYAGIGHFAGSNTVTRAEE